MGDQRIERHRAENGTMFTLVEVVDEVLAIRRDDLRGCWEVNGTVYATRDEAYAVAEANLHANPQPEPEVETTTVA